MQHRHSGAECSVVGQVREIGWVFAAAGISKHAGTRTHRNLIPPPFRNLLEGQKNWQTYSKTQTYRQTAATASHHAGRTQRWDNYLLDKSKSRGITARAKFRSECATCLPKKISTWDSGECSSSSQIRTASLGYSVMSSPAAQKYHPLEIHQMLRVPTGWGQSGCISSPSISRVTKSPFPAPLMVLSRDSQRKRFRFVILVVRIMRHTASSLSPLACRYWARIVANSMANSSNESSSSLHGAIRNAGVLAGRRARERLKENWWVLGVMKVRTITQVQASARARIATGRF